MPSAFGIEGFLLSVVVHGGYVLLPAKIEYKCGKILASVGGQYNLLTVLVRDVHVQLPVPTAG